MQGSYARECGALNSHIGRGAALIHVSLAMTIISGLLARMSKEDDALRKTFGKQWEEWAKRVPYKLIPWVY
jgi:protein-S-isoprenylcysteine O-methyltransferase Ste14